MKEALAIIIVILMGAFAATKAEGYYEDPSYTSLLAPVYSHIDGSGEKDWNSEISFLAENIAKEENEYVKSGLSKVLLSLIKEQEKKNTSVYNSFIQ